MLSLNVIRFPDLINFPNSGLLSQSLDPEKEKMHTGSEFWIYDFIHSWHFFLILHLVQKLMAFQVHIYISILNYL